MEKVCLRILLELPYQNNTDSYYESVFSGPATSSCAVADTQTAELDTSDAAVVS